MTYSLFGRPSAQRMNAHTDHAWRRLVRGNNGYYNGMNLYAWQNPSEVTVMIRMEPPAVQYTWSLPDWNQQPFIITALEYPDGQPP